MVVEVFLGAGVVSAFSCMLDALGLHSWPVYWITIGAVIAWVAFVSTVIVLVGRAKS